MYYMYIICIYGVQRVGRVLVAERYLIKNASIVSRNENVMDNLILVICISFPGGSVLGIDQIS